MKNIITIIAAAVLAGCATAPSSYSPLIDGSDPAKIAIDTQECNAYARQVQGAADKAMAGALAGALIGGALNAAFGGKGYGNEAAAFGAVTGALEGANAGARDQQSVMRKCLQGRGHRVLN